MGIKAKPAKEAEPAKEPAAAVVEPKEETKKDEQKTFAEDSARTFVEAATVHEVYSSGQTCRDCGAPVLSTWESCPFCGCTSMLSRNKNPKAEKWDYKAAIKTGKEIKKTQKDESQK